MRNQSSSPLVPVIYIILAIISVQIGAAIAKSTFPVLGAATTASFRIVLSALFLYLIFRPNLFRLSADQWKAVIPYGLAMGAMNLTFYLAIERIPLGLGVTLEFVGPLLLAVTKSRKNSDYIWVLLAAAGIVLISPWNAQNIDPIGALLALLAGGFWAAYIILGGRVSQQMSGSQAVTVGMMFASLLVLPFGAFSGGFKAFNNDMLFSLSALAILSSAVPFLLEMKALELLPARTFSILMSLEPSAAALSGIFFLKEYLSFNEWLAIALIVSASAGATLTAGQKKAGAKD